MHALAPGAMGWGTPPVVGSLQEERVVKRWQATEGPTVTSAAMLDSASTQE
jgi:hypothetical protein